MLRVFTEGRDEVFIQVYLEHLGYIHKTDFATDAAGGWQKIHEIAPKIKEYQDADDTVVIIFDADFITSGGGFAVRDAELKSLLVAESLEVDMFLFPNNDSDGDFESLMVQCAATPRNGVFGCFDAYETCVNGLTTDVEVFKTPLRKSKFFAYFECISEPETLKEQQRKSKRYFFDNAKYWNLNSPNLTKLKDFLVNSLAK